MDVNMDMDEHHPFPFVIKQEEIDGATQSDKILQFTLALQRQTINEVLIAQGNNDEEPLGMNRQPKTTEFIDLTLLSSNDEDSFVPQSRPGTNSNGLPAIDDCSHATIVIEESSPGDIGYRTDDYVHSTVGEYEMDTAAPALTDPHIVMYEEQQTAPRPIPNFADYEVPPPLQSTSAGKRPQSESRARPASVLKKSKNAMSPLPASVAGSTCSTSPREQLSSTQAISAAYLKIRTYPDRIEAQKGSPYFVYPKVRTCTRRNGQIYARPSFRCQECPYSVEKYETYLGHCDAHRIRREFTCTTCSFSTARQDYMDLHLPLHMVQPRNLEQQTNGSLPPPAPVTAPDRINKWKNGQGLKLRTSGPAGRGGRNTGSRCFKSCPKCPAKRYGTLNLQIHLEQHGKVGMRFTCPYCDYGSNRDDYMRGHIKDHLNSVDPDANTNQPTATSFSCI